jgi:hypothetical protein
MITLGNVVLDPNLGWQERYSSSEVGQSVRTTLGGRVVIQAAALQGGNNITLSASEDSGWLTKTMADELRVMSRDPGRVLYLTFHSDLVNVPVVFRHHEAPALDLRALQPKTTPLPEDYFIGTIKLMRI